MAKQLGRVRVSTGGPTMLICSRRRNRRPEVSTTVGSANTPPPPPVPRPWAFPMWGVSGTRKFHRMRKFLASLVLGKGGYSGFLANKKSTPLMDPKPPNISQAIM